MLADVRELSLQRRGYRFELFAARNLHHGRSNTRIRCGGRADRNAGRNFLALCQNFMTEFKWVDDLQQAGIALPAARHAPVTKNGSSVGWNLERARTDTVLA